MNNSLFPQFLLSSITVAKSNLNSNPKRWSEMKGTGHEIIHALNNMLKCNFSCYVDKVKKIIAAELLF